MQLNHIYETDIGLIDLNGNRYSNNKEIIGKIDFSHNGKEVAEVNTIYLYEQFIVNDFDTVILKYNGTPLFEFNFKDNATANNFTLKVYGKDASFCGGEIYSFRELPNEIKDLFSMLNERKTGKVQVNHSYAEIKPTNIHIYTRNISILSDNALEIISDIDNYLVNIPKKFKEYKTTTRLKHLYLYEAPVNDFEIKEDILIVYFEDYNFIEYALDYLLSKYYIVDVLLSDNNKVIKIRDNLNSTFEVNKILDHVFNMQYNKVQETAEDISRTKAIYALIQFTHILYLDSLHYTGSKYPKEPVTSLSTYNDNKHILADYVMVNQL